MGFGTVKKWNVAALLFLSAAVVFASGCGEDEPPPPPQVRIGGRTWTVELAMTPRQRYRGLSGRRELAEDCGMLFVYPRAKTLTFVMRGCLIPIDIVFIGPDGRAVCVHEMVPEPGGAEKIRYKSVCAAQYALELAGGQIRQAGIRVGDPVEFIHVPPADQARADE
jgi:uncharacterized membrane protein (UPF0127 family)